MSERSLAMKVAAGVSAAAAAFVLSSCGESSRPQFNHRTETRLERVMTPKMRRIARTAIMLESTSPRQVKAYTKNGFTQISGSSTFNGTNKNGRYNIDVVTRNYSRTEIPNPSDVLVASIESNPNITKKGQTSDTGIMFEAPGNTFTANNGASSSTRIYGYDSRNWIAVKYKDSGTNGDLFREDTINTADSSELIANENGIHAVRRDPVIAAQSIASAAPDILHSVVVSFNH